MSGRLVIGVDVGGTFTDLFFLDEASGRSWIGKVPSTRGREAIGFLNGVRQGTDDLSQVATVVHGTTVGTNALLERKGGKAGVIATEGFRDVLEMRRRDRPQTWGLWGQFEPVVPRERRVEVRERVLADGTVHQAIDPEDVKARARDLLALGAQAVAVTFINSYANGQNERIAAEALKSVWPNAYVNISSEILPEIREFERTSTTVLNAYLQPVVADYLDRLEADLNAQGFTGQLLIVQSNGGVMTIETAKARPVRTALSGPAAGVIAAAHIAETAGFPNVVTGDIGGTSFDVSLIAGGQTALAAQTAIDFGLVVRTPMIEITTIGAGGGSIASVDRGGLLQVGPESAGAVPGPVCYGQGNDRPTLTDANVVLGRINAERPIGGGLARLDVEAAKAAIAKHIGDPLGLDPVAAAEAIVRVANSRMAGAIRLVSIERGHNPRDFALMPFGGGGALHAGALVKEVGLKAALIPPYPGVTSALGCVIADMRHDFVQTVNRTLGEIDLSAFNTEIARMVEAGGRLLDRSNVVFTGRDIYVACDMLYLGQTHTVAVPIHWKKGLTLDRAAIRQAFEQKYRETYGRLLDGIAIRVLNLHVALIGRRPKLDLAVLAPSGGSIDSAKQGVRPVYVDGQWHEATIYARHQLPVGAVLSGPAILEQQDTTIFVEPDLQARVDALGNIIIEPM
ncbi:MAG TPA: hydantoinase/oxoprolinase family protein [Beijerinckiaceae bacterium]|jgi:N-methylhydantoinase A|nr:hydantoinase/oxoprolinase family protein [Beijerinckiaceae bacterium]